MQHSNTAGCILLKFYIKPQLVMENYARQGSCILSKFYIKPQRTLYAEFFDPVVSYRNSTSNHNYVGTYIVLYDVVSYRNSTSNHNNASDGDIGVLLYLIEILHQTTTQHISLFSASKLYLIEILHQTTTAMFSEFRASSLYLIEILHQTTTLLLVHP